MYFGLSQDQEMLQETVLRYLEKASDLTLIRQHLEKETGLLENLESGISDLGLPLMLVPEVYGGLGMGLLEASLMQMALGRYVTPVAFTGRYVLSALAFQGIEDEDKRAAYMGDLANQTKQFAIGLTEQTGAREGSGLSLAGDGLSGECLSGRASFVLDFHGATHVLLPVGDHLLCVEAREANVCELETIDATRKVVILDFENAKVDVLSAQFGATTARLVDAGRVLLAADSFGAAEMMLEKAVAYSKERKQFDRVIGSFQAVKHMCAEMAANLEPCRSFLWYAAYAFDAVPEEAPLMSRLVKARLADVGRDIARGTTEVHGGMGFTDLLGLHYWFKRIGLNRQLLGGPVKLREEAAQLQGWGA